MESELISLGEKIHYALLNFNKIKNLFSYDLTGACAVGSYLFAKEAKNKLDLNVKFLACSSHAWTEYKNKIYDVTATQFGIKKPVFVIEKEKVFDGSMYQYDYKYQETIKVINKTWPSEQRPSRYKLCWVNQHKAKISYVRF